MPANLGEVLESEDIAGLDVKLDHALAVSDLPLHHQDPFDRIQISQTKLEGLVLISADPRIHAYDVERLRA